MMNPSNKLRAGFSLLELVVTLSILAILVGVVSFRSGDVVEMSRVSKVLTLIETLESACAQHHADTGVLAHEYPGYSAEHCELSSDQDTPGWNGPYVDGPLTHNHSNPFGSLHLYDNPRTNDWIDGFDVQGDGQIEVEENANMLWLSGVDEESAQMIDDEIDADVEGEASKTGRVRWDRANNYCWVLIHR